MSVLGRAGLALDVLTASFQATRRWVGPSIIGAQSRRAELGRAEAEEAAPTLVRGRLCPLQRSARRDRNVMGNGLMRSFVISIAAALSLIGFAASAQQPQSADAARAAQLIAAGPHVLTDYELHHLLKGRTLTSMTDLGERLTISYSEGGNASPSTNQGTWTVKDGKVFLSWMAPDFATGIRTVRPVLWHEIGPGVHDPLADLVAKNRTLATLSSSRGPSAHGMTIGWVRNG
jgi:hypothetical protein